SFRSLSDALLMVVLSWVFWAEHTPAPVSGHQQDLADVLARLHQAMGIGRRLEREAAVDHRRQPICPEPRPDRLLELGADPTLLRDAAGPQRRSGDRRVSDQHL